MKKVLNTFLAGLSAVLPAAISFFILLKSFDFIDGILGKWIVKILGYPIPGVGFIVTLTSIYFVGLFAKHYFGEKILEIIENLMKRIPIIHMIYGGVRDLSSLLTKGDKKSFTQVVKVHFPSPSQVSIGLITNESIVIDHEDLVAVFIPTTPNPSNGFLVYIPRREIIILDIPIDRAIKMIVSMGSVSPDIIKAMRTGTHK